MPASHEVCAFIVIFYGGGYISLICAQTANGTVPAVPPPKPPTCSSLKMIFKKASLLM